MLIEVKIPSPGESVTEVSIGSWLVADGDIIIKDQEIAEVETDKATLPIVAPESGKIKIVAETGKKVSPGDVACTIDTSEASHGQPQPEVPAGTATEEKPVISEEAAIGMKGGKDQDMEKQEVTPSESGSSGQKKDVSGLSPEKLKKEDDTHENTAKPTYAGVKATPVAKRIMEEHNLSIDDIINGLKKLSRPQVEKVIELSGRDNGKAVHEGERKTEAVPMSAFRRKLAARLVTVRNETAMLTTFNEVDMSSVMNLRKKYQQEFQEKQNIKLGIMSFFVKASAISLMDFPRVNAKIDGENLIYQYFADISIAVQTDKGLMVPIIRNADKLGIPEIEKAIAVLADKARTNRLPIEDMTGGTFTITNGGIFGSMLSTPLINPPQAAILGLHNISDRPVVIEGKVEVRPVMYIALSYDHRIIDGKDSVSFLANIKKLIEDPLLMAGRDYEKDLLKL